MSEKPMSNEFHGDNWHPDEVSPDEIVHDEQMNKERKDKEDPRVVLLRDTALKSLKPEFSPTYRYAGSDVDHKRMEYEPCDQLIKEIGARRTEEILQNSELSLEKKNKILADLNYNLNRGIDIVKSTRYDDKKKFTISDGVEIKKGEVEIKDSFIKNKGSKVSISEKEKVAETLEGLLIGHLMYRFQDRAKSAINNIEALARLQGNDLHETIARYLRPLEQFRSRSGEGSSGGGDEEQSDRILMSLGYTWDAESKHYVSLKEEKK